MFKENEVQWERMFPYQLESAFKNCPSVYYAYGMCEPHGYHNAIGLDALKAHGICVEAAKQHGGIVAPPDYWHIHELGGYALWGEWSIRNERPWMTAVPPWVHFKNVCYHIRAAEILGFESAILLTGHYGPNWMDLKTLVEKVQPYCRIQLHGLPDFEANKPGFPGDGASGDHAGKVETSLLWAIEPDLVKPELIPENLQEDERPMACGIDADQSSKEAGEQMFADEVKWLGSKQAELREQYDATKTSKFETFDDVETFWQTEIHPLIDAFETKKHYWEEKNKGRQPAEDSIWAKNYPVGPWRG